MRNMPTGMPLPTVRELASEFSVGMNTVHGAYRVMADHGLIERRPRKGVFVADRVAKGEFAVTLDSSLLRPDASPYFSLAATAIAEALSDRNSRWGAKLHLGRGSKSAGEYLESLDLLEPDVLKRLRGVFTFHPLAWLEARLKAARIPVVNLWSSLDASPSEPGVNTVVFDYRSFYVKAFAHLKETGCRTVGVLALFYKVNRDREMAALVQCAEAHGLRICPEWLRLSMDWDEKRESMEQMAYAAFCPLGTSPSRPDGLLVTDDVACHGVLRASLRLGLEFPDQLRLVSHANHGAPFAYHKDVTRVEFDPAAQARAAVELMTRLLRSREAAEPSILVPATLVKGATT
jgi:DNA-binding LacI/PurR family transcriptional regulator